MSNLSDFLDAVGKLNGGATGGSANAVGLAGNSLGLLADLSGAVGFVSLAQSTIQSILGQDDQVTSLLKQLQQEFEQLAVNQKAEDTLERMRDLETTIVDAEAVLKTLKETVSQNPPVDNEYRLAQVQTCVAAVIGLTDLEGTDNKWRAVYGDQTYYQDLWGGPIGPGPDGDGLVFNYTYVLPLYLRSIYIMLTTIGTLLPKDVQNYSSVLSDCVTRLQLVHDTVLNDGIVPLRMPVASELWALNTSGQGNSPFVTSLPDGRFLGGSAWCGGPSGNPYGVYGSEWPFQLYGAVERYSGTSVVRSYPPLDVPPSVPFGPPFIPHPDEAWLTAVLVKLALRTLKSQKDVYATTGMPAVFSVANHLRKIIGQAQLPSPAIDHWTVLEIYKVLGYQARWGADWHRPHPPGLLAPSPTLLQLRSFLETVPPTETGPDYSHLMPYAPTSLRAMLDP